MCFRTYPSIKTTFIVLNHKHTGFIQFLTNPISSVFFLRGVPGARQSIHILLLLGEEANADWREDLQENELFTLSLKQPGMNV